MFCEYEDCNLTPPCFTELSRGRGLTWDNSADGGACPADAGDDDEAKSLVLQPGDGHVVRIAGGHPRHLAGLPVALLWLSPPDSERHLAPLSGVAHHPHHHVMAGAQDGLPVHPDDLVAREQPAVQVSRSPRYNVPYGDLVGILRLGWYCNS